MLLIVFKNTLLLAFINLFVLHSTHNWDMICSNWCFFLQEEKFRNERLEEQINDLTELHQNEVENLKQALADMEEKVQYQSEERLRDIQDMLDHCQTKVRVDFNNKQI